MEKGITKEQVMGLLLSACPSYSERWEKYLEENYEDGDEQLLYIDVADFANHIIEIYKLNETEEFEAVFEVIELLHIQGDEFVKELATIGLLEDIHLSLTDKQEHDFFVKYLKPESLQWWNYLFDFWSGKLFNERPKSPQLNTSLESSKKRTKKQRRDAKNGKKYK
ncbi:hypothetical protein QNH39_18580 [Neobacillus novalis]|uniref:DUF7674 domain-containing protein n=1 Tax=Neobacillus novalis TaxID=220687 RepID=A0AA95S7D1_9BACI|nr:hypothetical protein [Neobacillus novalis]WHY84645.1 hypothetical protein QNH39_18580 [Neobacillus novalis]